MEDTKLIDYAFKYCNNCHEKTGLYCSVCDKCGDWLEFQISIKRFLNDIRCYTDGLYTFNLKLSEMLKNYLEPAIFNYVASASIIIMLNSIKKYLVTIRKEIDEIPNCASNIKQKNLIKKILHPLDNQLKNEAKKVNTSLRSIKDLDIKNPLKIEFEKYSDLWYKWNELKQSDPNNKDITKIAEKLQSQLNSINILKQDLEAALTSLTKNFIRFLEETTLDSKLDHSSSFKRIKKEYQIINSVLLFLIKFQFQSGGYNGSVVSEIPIYPIKKIITRC